jgi:hypothetical protein
MEEQFTQKKAGKKQVGRNTPKLFEIHEIAIILMPNPNL